MYVLLGNIGQRRQHSGAPYVRFRGFLSGLMEPRGLCPLPQRTWLIPALASPRCARFPPVSVTGSVRGVTALVFKSPLCRLIMAPRCQSSNAGNANRSKRSRISPIRKGKLYAEVAKISIGSEALSTKSGRKRSLGWCCFTARSVVAKRCFTTPPSVTSPHRSWCHRLTWAQ